MRKNQVAVISQKEYEITQKALEKDIFAENNSKQMKPENIAPPSKPLEADLDD